MAKLKTFLTEQFAEVDEKLNEVMREARNNAITELLGDLSNMVEFLTSLEAYVKPLEDMTLNDVEIQGGYSIDKETLLSSLLLFSANPLSQEPPGRLASPGSNRKAERRKSMKFLLNSIHATYGRIQMTEMPKSLKKTYVP